MGFSRATMPETMPVLRCFELMECISNIGLRNNGVAFKDSPSTPAADFHNHALCYSSPPEVTSCRSSEIVKNQPSVSQSRNGPTFVAGVTVGFCIYWFATSWTRQHP